MTDEPVDPITALAEGAAQIHELFLAYVNAGFTPEQALRIVIGMVQGAAAAGSAS